MLKKEILLAHFKPMTSKRYREILAAFSDLETVWQAEFDELKKLNWRDNTIHEFLTWRDNLDEEKINEKLTAEKIHCITINDPDYPPLLKEIFDPPFCLFVRGNIQNIENPLAVVGPRRYSAYGKQITEDIVRQLAQAGLTIMSGLALGIDGIAHKAALQSNGRTCAVLGTGIDRDTLYPACHRQLAEQIIENNGAIISEYPPGTRGSHFTFPQRNRIVAGISLGTLVIEAAEGSGSLITAQCSLDNGREVFCIPQNITSPTSSGVNKFLKNGAILVTEAEDILNVFNIQETTKNIQTKVKPNNPLEEKILKCLSKEPVHIDMIIKQTGLSSQETNSMLLMLEMQGKARNTGAMMYILAA